VRMVTHVGISDEDVEIALRAWRTIAAMPSSDANR
jgi:hypothetical protein